MPTERLRLDLLLTQLGLFESRQQAQTAIMDGGILVNGQKETKPGTQVTLSARVELAPGWGQAKYVSRGGLKLEKALTEFAISPRGRICLDIGASTGGFTDCLLKHGALKVYAVDVGYGQLDWLLRQDNRVCVKERINARQLTAEMLYQQGDQLAQLAVIDVSFISLAKIVPACLNVLEPDSPEIISLIKPQFEAGRQAVGKGGVVRSHLVHTQIIEDLIKCFTNLGLHLQALTFSPIKGPAGNIEYLAYWARSINTSSIAPDTIVRNAFQSLNG